MSSRVWKLGTVFSRTEALLKTKAMPEDLKPLWFDIWEKYPPKVSPSFDRPVSNIELKPIFYEEDVLRAKINKKYPRSHVIDLTSNRPTKSQQCVTVYRKLVEEGKSSNQAMDLAIGQIYERH